MKGRNIITPSIRTITPIRTGGMTRGGDPIPARTGPLRRGGEKRLQLFCVQKGFCLREKNEVLYLFYPGKQNSNTSTDATRSRLIFIL
jgi:hypothetical protein